MFREKLKTTIKKLRKNNCMKLKHNSNAEYINISLSYFQNA